MKTIAIVDDDEYIGNMLEEVLKKEGYEILRAYSGTELLLLLSKQKPNLILLDLMLPGMNGEDILPKVKNIPVIVISAKGGIEDKVKLLLDGAVDYITKPFHTQELLARIKVQLRKEVIDKENGILNFHDLILDTINHTVTIAEKQIKLTKTEYAILKLLMQHPTQVLTKSQILDSISEDTPDCMESTLKVHISNLRRKLKEVSEKEYIESVWGIGFKLSGENE